MVSSYDELSEAQRDELEQDIIDLNSARQEWAKNPFQNPQGTRLAEEIRLEQKYGFLGEQISSSSLSSRDAITLQTQRSEDLAQRRYATETKGKIDYPTFQKKRAGQIRSGKIISTTQGTTSETFYRGVEPLLFSKGIAENLRGITQTKPSGAVILPYEKPTLRQKIAGKFRIASEKFSEFGEKFEPNFTEQEELNKPYKYSAIALSNVAIVPKSIAFAGKIATASIAEALDYRKGVISAEIRSSLKQTAKETKKDPLASIVGITSGFVIGGCLSGLKSIKSTPKTLTKIDQQIVSLGKTKPIISYVAEVKPTAVKRVYDVNALAKTTYGKKIISTQNIKGIAISPTQARVYLSESASLSIPKGASILKGRSITELSKNVYAAHKFYSASFKKGKLGKAYLTPAYTEATQIAKISKIRGKLIKKAVNIKEPSQYGLFANVFLRTTPKYNLMASLGKVTNIKNLIKVRGLTYFYKTPKHTLGLQGSLIKNAKGTIQITRQVTKTLPSIIEQKQISSSIAQQIRQPKIIKQIQRQKAIQLTKLKTRQVNVLAQAQQQTQALTLRSLATTATQLKQRTKQGQKQIQITPQIQLTRITPMLATAKAQAQQQRTATRTTTITKTMITPAPITPIVPITNISIITPPLISKIYGGAGGYPILSKIGAKRKYSYTPSLRATLFNIRGKLPKQKKFTGLEIRPITRGFKWY